MQLDSGSDVSILSLSDVNKIQVPILKTQQRLMGYGGSPITLCGQIETNVTYDNKSVLHKFYVTDSNAVNLLGRDLCAKLGISILMPDNIHVNSIDRLKSEFEHFLSDEFNSNVTETVNLKVLPDARPIFCKARTVPVRMKELVKKEIDRLVDAGKITKVFQSDWASPTVNVLKSNNSIRICGDFSATVNKYLDPVQTPLPTVDDVITQVGNAKVFSKIDLSQAFLQLPLDDNSKKFTTINTSEGLFQFNYLPFGLNCSPGIFQAYLSKLLNNITGVIVFQDDVLIMSEDMQEHEKSLTKVLSALRDAGMKLNREKCYFFVNSVLYLGHIFDSQGVRPNPEKVRAIIDAPSPTNIKQMQAFIGLCNFYRQFIPDFATIMSPLYSLLKKNVKFSWGEEQQNNFLYIKQLFLDTRVLPFFDPSYETLLETDASGYGIAAVLMQRRTPSDQWKPIQFASRSLNDAEKNYSNLEREALSVVFGIEKFQKFLLGSEFVIHNDQRPLQNLLASNKGIPTTCTARVQRWALRLSQYKYKFLYSKGEHNILSDCLSRLPLPDTTIVSEPYELVFTINSLNNHTITSEHIKQETALDPNLTELKQYVKYGCPSRIANPELSKIKGLISQMSIMNGCILFNNRVVVPHSLQNEVLQQFHTDHPGITAMKSLARSLIWFYGMDKQIEDIVNNCDICQSVRSRPAQVNIEWPTPVRPWSRVHVDHCFIENKVCLVAVDALTKYLEVEIVSNTSVQETIDALRLIFSRHGLCDVIVSDNASCFTAQSFQDFLTNNGIHHITPPPYSPASNGQAERCVRIVKDLLKKCSSSDSFKSRLSKVLFYYRSVPHSVTSIAPCVALNKRKFVTVNDRVHPSYNFNSKLRSSVHTMRQFVVGEHVLALNLREGPKWYHATIVQKLGPNIYNVHIHQLDVIWKRHLNQLLSVSCKSEIASKNQNDKASSSVPIQNKACPNYSSQLNNSPIVNTGSEFIQRRMSSRTRKPVSRYGFD